MVRYSTRSLAALLFVFAACSKPEQETPSGAQFVTPGAPQQAAPSAPTPPPGAKVFFISPTDGAEIKGPAVDGKVEVKVKMGVEGIDLAPAGEQKPASGHHHIIVDGQFIAMGTVVPKDEKHLHYGKAESEATIALTPGPHTLTLQFADGAHLSYGPQLSASIRVNVVVDPNAPSTTAQAE